MENLAEFGKLLIPVAIAIIKYIAERFAKKGGIDPLEAQALAVLNSILELIEGAT